MFFSPTSNAKLEISEPKIQIVSKVNYDKGKSILGAPLRLLKKLNRTIIAPLIRSLNQRNLTSVIIVKQQYTLIQIAISGLLLKLLRKRISRTIITPLIRSLNQRNHTSVITVENRDTLFQIAISGLLLNKAIVCHLLEAKINFKTLWLLLENF